MADKRIDELEAASSVTTNDLFVLEQAGTAKKLEAQTLENWLLALAQGHGGIISIAKTSSSGTDPVIDTYTITFSDTTTSTFTVTNGLKGDQGDQTYVYIKYSTRDPIADTDITDTPSDWMGICSTTSSTAPTTYTSYKWYEIKGDKGDKGDSVTVSSTSVTYQAWSSGTQYPTGTWVANPPAVTPGNFLWTRTIVNYSDGGQTVSYSVGRWGMDGTGAVSSVNNNLPDQNGNVTLTYSDVGALPDSYQPPVTSVQGKTGTIVLLASDVAAMREKSVEATTSAAGWYRAFEYDAYDSSSALGSSGEIASIKIIETSTASSQHDIKLFLATNNVKFLDEVSCGTYTLVDKIRYTVNGDKGYIDIHVSTASSITINARISVASRDYAQTNWIPKTLASVDDAPTGETIVTTHNFTSNSEWSAVDTKTGTASSTLPSNWKEIVVNVRFGGNTTYGFTFYVRKDCMYAASERYMQGAYNSATDFHFCAIEVGSVGVALNTWTYRGSDYTSSSKIYVQYKC